MGTDQLKELKRLQKENERLRRAVSDLTLDKLVLCEAARGSLQKSKVSQTSGFHVDLRFPKPDEQHVRALLGNTCSLFCS